MVGDFHQGLAVVEGARESEAVVALQYKSQVADFGAGDLEISFNEGGHGGSNAGESSRRPVRA